MMLQHRNDSCTFSDAQPEDGPDEVLSHTPIADQRREERARRAALARNSSGRRRFVDPTTSEKDYSAAEVEFMHAMQEYKQKSNRMFPTWSEVLEVLRTLGYEKVPVKPDGL